MNSRIQHMAVSWIRSSGREIRGSEEGQQDQLECSLSLALPKEWDWRGPDGCTASGLTNTPLPFLAFGFLGGTVPGQSNSFMANCMSSHGSLPSLGPCPW